MRASAGSRRASRASARRSRRRATKTHLWFVGDPELPGARAARRPRAAPLVPVAEPPPSERRLRRRSTPRCPTTRRRCRPSCARAPAAAPARGRHARWCWPRSGRPRTRCCTSTTCCAREGVRDRVRILWNANNVFGFEHIDWPRLREAALDHHRQPLHEAGMKARRRRSDRDPERAFADAYLPPDRAAVAQLRAQLRRSHGAHQDGALGSGQALARDGRHRRASCATSGRSRC